MITFAQHQGRVALLKDAKGFPKIESLIGRKERMALTHLLSTQAPISHAPSTAPGISRCTR